MNRIRGSTSVRAQATLQNVDGKPLSEIPGMMVELDGSGRTKNHSGLFSQACCEGPEKSHSASGLAPGSVQPTKR